MTSVGSRGLVMVDPASKAGGRLRKTRFVLVCSYRNSYIPSMKTGQHRR